MHSSPRSTSRLTTIALCIGAACAAGSVAAQSAGVIPLRSLALGESRIEFYGVLDAGIETIDNGGSRSTRLSSGISGGSRWGIRGTEDMGGNYRTFFELESRIELDNGTVQSSSPFVSSDLPANTFAAGTPAALIAAATPTLIATQQGLQRLVTTVNRDNALFDRTAIVGLATPVGAIIAGRIYTPGYEIMNAYSVYGDATAGQIGQGYAAVTIRANNAVAYRVRFAEKLLISLMYSFGGNETLGFGRAERTIAPTRADDFYGANIRWTGDGIDIGAGWNRNQTFKPSTNEAVKGLETIHAGTAYKIGSFRLYGEAMTRKNNNPLFEGLPTPATVAQFNAIQPFLSYQDADLVVGRLGKTDTRVYHASTGYWTGSGTVTLGYTRADDRRAENADVDHYSIGYFHEVSKRTTLYTDFAFARNHNTARMALGSAGFSGGFVDKTGDDSRVFQVGLRHVF
ncbi:hypothetical protein BH09PSE6_BH09PSE6_22260 [soil metagenome]